MNRASTFVSIDLARELRALLADDRRALGARGRAFAEREHAWERAFDRLFAVYASLVR